MAANPTLTPDEVEMVLENSADEIAGAWHPYYGNGRVNAATAVQLAMTMDTIPVDNEAPAVNIFSPVSGTQVSGIALVEVNASDNVEFFVHDGGHYFRSDVASEWFSKVL